MYGNVSFHSPTYARTPVDDERRLFKHRVSRCSARIERREGTIRATSTPTIPNVTSTSISVKPA